MPLYEFSCPEHGPFTVMASIANIPSTAPCQHCDRQLARIEIPLSQNPPRFAYEFKLQTSEGMKRPDDPKRKGPRVKLE